VVATVARGGDLGRDEEPVKPALVLASTSPQRRAILEQLRIPFVVEPPDYEEHDPPEAKPVDLVRAHAVGKARSVHQIGNRTLGVDTTVHCAGRLYGKAVDAGEAGVMLRELSGRTHAVLSGLCLITPEGEAVEHAETLVTFRRLDDDLVAVYLASGEWRGRAGAYAIQGLGGRFVERIEGDYLNVVGLPGALLVAMLERSAPTLLRTT
jgi:septum formation protein